MTKLYGQEAIQFANANGLNLSSDDGMLSVAEAKDLAKRDPEAIWIDTTPDPEDGSNVR